MIVVSIDGVLVPAEEARISIFDRGFLYGDGVFEVLRTWDGVLVDLDAHLERLYASAGWLQMVALDRARLAEVAARTLASAGPGEHRVRIVLTRGEGTLTARPATLGPGRAIVVVEPLPPQPAEVSLAVVDWSVPARTSHGHKTLAYLDHLIARELAATAGADEAVRLDSEGHVVECATSNIFCVMQGAVITPPLAGALPGITRHRVLAACRAAGIDARETQLSVERLRAAEEIFITSALRGVVAVTRLDGAPLARGPLTGRIATLVRAGLSSGAAPAI